MSLLPLTHTHGVSFYSDLIIKRGSELKDGLREIVNV